VSSLVFPSSLPGFSPVVTREPYSKTVVQEGLSGKEIRSTWWSSPRYRYRVGFEFLRSAAAYAELQQLAGHFARHFAQLDSFLFTDPDDCSVTDHGFGVGNGSTTTFQLQRTLGGYYSDAIGTYPQSSKPRTNLCLYSQDFHDASWVGSAGGTGASGAVIADACAAPDGTATADQITLNRGSGNTFTDQSWIYHGSIPTPSGAQCVGSIWMRAASGTCDVAWRPDGTALPLQVVTLTTAWQRFTVAYVASSSATVFEIKSRGTITTTNSPTFFAWGCQVESGSVATAYIPTTSAAVTVTPAYWPAMGDGFEPVQEPNGPISVFLDKDWQGYRQLCPWARTNLALYSAQIDQWALSQLTVTANNATAPDGTATADTLTKSNTTAGAIADQSVTVAAGAQYTSSVWLQGTGTSTRADFGLYSGSWPAWTAQIVSGPGTLAASSGAAGTLPSITGLSTTQWTRVAVTVAALATPSRPRIYPDTSASTTSGAAIRAWGAQVEAGPTATQYIPTVATSVTAPADYTLAAGGLVTLASAPAVGVALSWTGSYFRRVRFSQDNLSAERILSQLWQAQGVELVSVK